MVERVPFIDREKELALAEALINQWDTRHTLCIQADGGIGKTRLLQEIHKRHARSAPSFLPDTLARQEVTIAVVNEFTGTEWAEQFVAGVQSMAEGLGVHLIETDANFDMDQMVADLEGVIDQSPDAIVVRLGTSERLRPGIQRALAQGIKVLTLDNYLPRIEGLTTRVTLDYYEGAHLSLEKMVQELDYHGKIAAFWVESVAMQEGRKQILDNILLKYPDVELVAEFGFMGADMARVIHDKTIEILDAHPDLQAIWVTWDEFTRGVVQALMEKEHADILVHSFDLSPSDVELMLQPGSPWQATVAINPTEVGRIVVRLATQAAYGSDIERHYSVPMKLITQQALRQIKADDRSPWSESEIGWTPLLRSLQTQVQSGKEMGLLVTDIIDFDDRTLHFPQNLARKIAQMLDPDAFAPYFRALLDWRRMERAGFSPERLAQERLSVTGTFADCFNAISDDQRVLLFLDTTDALETGGEVWRDIIEIVPRLENSVTLIAGRDAAQLDEQLQPRMGKDVQTITLPPLPKAASASYLRQKQDLLHITLEPELAEKLLFLSAGRPILIDLALEWLTREIPLDWLVESSLQELRALPPEQRQARRDEFERQLVRHIAETRTPMDWLTLTMSHVYPLNAGMLPGLLQMPDEQAQALFDRAQNYVFVKQLPDDHISLHDEMRRMVNEHVWSQVDPQGERRRRDSRFAAAHFERKVEALREEMAQSQSADRARRAVTPESADLERRYWVAQVARVRYALHADWGKGMDVFAEAFDEAARHKQSEVRDLLLNLARENVEQAAKQQLYDKEMRYKYEIRLARQKLDRLELEQSRQILAALQADYAEPGRQVDVLSRLARCAQLSGNLPEAIAYLQQALEICQTRPEMMSAWGGTILNTLGWMLRLVGRWEEAAEHYRRSIDLIAETGDEARLATAYNNMGYITGLQSNYDSALMYCRRALAIQESLGLEYHSGLTHNTLGIIHRGKEDYDLSLKHTNQALSIFEEFEDKEWLSKAYCERGITRWHMEEYRAAQADLEKSYQLYTEMGLRFELANILHRQGHVAWDLGNLEEAERYFQESAQVGQQVSDFQQTVNSLEGLVELYYFIGQEYHEQGALQERDEWYAKAEQMAQLWKTEYEDKGYYFPLYSGSRIRILGNIAYDRGDYDTALQRYMEALPRIASRGGYSKYMLPKALERLQARIDGLPAEIALEWCDRIQEFWEAQGLDDDFPEMITMCEISRDNARRRAAS